MAKVTEDRAAPALFVQPRARGEPPAVGGFQPRASGGARMRRAGHAPQDAAAGEDRRRAEISRDRDLQDRGAARARSLGLADGKDRRLPRRRRVRRPAPAARRRRQARSASPIPRNRARLWRARRSAASVRPSCLRERFDLRRTDAGGDDRRAGGSGRCGQDIGDCGAHIGHLPVGDIAAALRQSSSGASPASRPKQRAKRATLSSTDLPRPSAVAC